MLVVKSPKNKSTFLNCLRVKTDGFFTFLRRHKSNTSNDPIKNVARASSFFYIHFFAVTTGLQIDVL